MNRPPEMPKRESFAGGMGFDVIAQGIIITIITLTAYFIGHYVESGRFEITTSADGITMAFLSLSMAEIFHSFNMRSRRESIFRLKRQNIFIWGAMILSFLCTTAVIYIPFLSDAFGFEHISLMEYGIAMLLAFSIIPIIEIIKLIQRIAENNGRRHMPSPVILSSRCFLMTDWKLSRPDLCFTIALDFFLIYTYPFLIQRKRSSHTAGSPGSSNAVNIVFVVLRKIIVEYGLHFFNINSACSNISSHKYIRLAGSGSLSLPGSAVPASYRRAVPALHIPVF